MEYSADYIIIGSGFGGSVSALRLAEKGYRVLVIERGRRFYSPEFPKTNWAVSKYLWLPQLACYGIQAMTLLKNAFILHGSGVGGGSLVYANNLLVPPDSVLADPAWGRPDWPETILPYYAKARTMLGATPARNTTLGDDLLRQVAEKEGRGGTFHINDVGVYFGKPNESVPDPFFDGRGPERSGCTECGGCMVGCRENAKNTLDKNYLYLAEQLGVRVISDHSVNDVRPRTGGGYIVSVSRVSGWSHPRRTFTAKGVIFAGGVMGTVKLLHQCKKSGSLTRLSPQLGERVRTNSEALVGIVAGDGEDYSKGIAITSGVYPDSDTQIETVRYGKGQDLMALLTTPMVDDHPPLPRPVLFLLTIFRHPIQFIKTFFPKGWAQKTTILLVMQKIDNYLRFDYKPRWWRLGRPSLNSNWNTDRKIPSYIPVANRYAKKMAAKVNGSAKSVLPEVIFNTSSTAHILGGCCMGETPEDGVIDYNGKIHGYDNLYVLDGSIIPVNLSVNPSLTITALSEYLINQFPEN